MTNKRIADITLYTAAALFLLSLTQVSYCTQTCERAVMAFLLGWIGVLLEFGNLIASIMAFLFGNEFSLRNPIGASFSWLANPILILALIALRKDVRMAVRLSVISTLLILSFLLFRRIVDNEAGGYTEITGYGAGYWLWLSSSVTVLVGALILMRRSKK